MDPASVAAEIDAAVRLRGPSTTAEARAIRRRWSRVLRTGSGHDVFAVAMALLEQHGQRFLAYELIRFHPDALALVDSHAAERLGRELGSWGEVDMFATLVAGQAWRLGTIGDDAIRSWARRPDRWWRRAALVSTVPLNVKNQGGSGDPHRTLAVSELLVDDRDDMVVKALSWALRELIVHDQPAVERFLALHRTRLAPRVLREVGNKLRTGLKTPTQGRAGTGAAQRS